MSSGSDQEREDRALDALIVAASRPDLWPQAPARPPAPDAGLTKEDRRALDALGPDLAARVAAGQWAPRARPRPARPRRRGRPRLTGALHRAEEDAGLTEEARQEMERKVRELEAEGDGGSPP
jgi:hypothetical protein